jgi:hypothetical protein
MNGHPPAQAGDRTRLTGFLDILIVKNRLETGGFSFIRQERILMDSFLIRETMQAGIKNGSQKQPPAQGQNKHKKSDHFYNPHTH